ncbi:D-erythronate dehydrogenase [Marinobacter sp. X15-166B]|uniref:D-erythronate dehydrogenase n=1 Tax=Marinobacter sp. X15-166B TaxID=1897620 RepID=UPI00085BBFDA|nr:D-erythronate dehydrogenase [Marinobacter sp. X15-166B]OEY67497.1 NAD-dependent epimerase [Marinobacter sp. X15-166B]
MRILITGAAGFLGQRLIRALAQRGTLGGQPLAHLILLDQVTPATPAGMPCKVTARATDLTAPGALDAALDDRPDVVFHLAAVVSSAAEADLDLGMAVNFDVTRTLLEACRARGLSDTRLIMASSVATYGGDLPPVLDDMTAVTPQSSYGTQKAMSELLVNDYSRRGLVDGRVLRLPTIVIRPGRPNAAASSFASSILREPLNHEEAVCPVPTDLELFVMSPGKVIEALLHGAGIPEHAFGPWRSLMLPGITVSVAGMLDSLRTLGGDEALARVKHQPDPRIEAIVASWPARFDTRRAQQLGFKSDNNFGEIVEAFLDDRAKPL